MTAELVKDEEGVLDTSLENTRNPTWVSELLQDRPRLIELLTDFAGASPRQELLIQHLAEKSSKGKEAPLQDVLRRITMSRLEFYTIVKACRTTKSEFRTGQILDIFRPKVTKAVMEGALNTTHTCFTCEGKGSITVSELVPLQETDEDREAREDAGKRARRKREERTVTCTSCFGVGKVTKYAEHERQITALEIAGVLKKGGPGTVVNVNNAVDNSFRSSPEFRRDTDKLMYATVVDISPATPLSSSQALPEASPAETISTAPPIATQGDGYLQPDNLHAPNGGSVESSVVLVGKMVAPPLGKRRNSGV